MARIVAVYGEDGLDVSILISMAMVASGYAGPEGCGLGIKTKKGFRKWGRSGVATQALAQMSAEEVAEYFGNVGIGHNSTNGNIMPLVIENRGGIEMLVAIDGSVEAEKAVIDWMKRGRTIEESVRLAMYQVCDDFALVALSADGELVGARNSGLMPLAVGTIEMEQDGRVFQGHYLSSQGGILDHGATYAHSVSPGEMIVLHAKGYVRKAILSTVKIKRCINEGLFQQGPVGNFCGGRPVTEIRGDVGEEMALRFSEKHHCLDRDLYTVLQIPDGGFYYGLKFAELLGLKYMPDVVVKNRYMHSGPVESRYTLAGFEPTINFDALNAIAASGNLINGGFAPSAESPPVMTCSQIRGKRVIVIDDTLWSGEIIKHIAHQCRLAGAAEVHAVTATVTAAHCFCGKDAHRSNKIALGSKGSLADIAVKLGIDSFTSLSEDRLVNAVGTPHRNYCLKCLRF
jgi:amidophosphoribosyltransferase